jgi:hypothetical protein
MSSYGFDSAIGVLRYLGYTIEDGRGCMFRSIRRAAAELSENPPGGIMAGTICAKKMKDVTLALCQEMFPAGTPVSYHAPHDWSVKFTGVCSDYTACVNNEYCRIVTVDESDDVVSCSVDLLEVLQPSA